MTLWVAERELLPYVPPVFPFSKAIQVGGVETDFQSVLKSVFPLLTPERRDRINQVVDQRCFSVVPVLENLYDRGNISAVLRSCEAFGLGAVHIVESEKLKESQRTTAGADKWVECFRWKSTAACVAELKKQGKQIAVTCLAPDSVPIGMVDFSKPTALVLGNEKDGASEEIIGAADVKIRIPMYGFVQSFNISVAAALCFYHLVEDRLRRQGSHGDLTDEQKQILRAIYASRTLDSSPDILKREQAAQI